MQFCVIAPVSHLHLTTLGNGIHMALTHLVHQSDDYTKFYQRMVSKNEYVILDNSAFEMEKQGKGLDPEPVLKAAKLVGAHEVIATDVLLNGQGTIDSTRAFIKEYVKFFGEEIRLGKPIPKIMAVPQGNTIDEWIDCYTRLVHMQRVQVLGFSKISVPVSFGGPNARKVSGGVIQARLKLLAHLADSKLLPSQIGQTGNAPCIHLLGGDDWSGYELDQVSQKYSKDVRSNDSSAPIWYGAQGVKFDSFTGKASQFVVEKPDLENTRQTTVESIDKNIAIVLANIAVFLKMANKLNTTTEVATVHAY